MNSRMPHPVSSSSRRRYGWGLLAGCFLLVLLSGCGGGSSTPTIPPSTPTTAVQFNMGDLPADWLLSFTMNVSALSLTASDGKTYYVSTSTVPVEMMQRLGTMEPVTIAGVPQKTWSRAGITIASCTFRYLDPSGNQVQKTLDGPFVTSVQLDSAVKLETTPYLFNFDLDLLHSLTTDGSGAFHFSPQFHHSSGVLDTSAVVASSTGNGYGNGINARYGGMYQMMGLVQGTTAASFSLRAMQSLDLLTVKVNEATRFQGRIQQMSELQAGMGVLVTARLQADGSLLATRVRATMSATGAMGGGIITAVNAVPATQLTIVMQNGAGASINTDYLSKTLTVNLTNDTSYEIDTDRVPLDAVPFTPVFDASNIYAGQSILPISDEGIVANASCDPTCGVLTATTVRLREQGFRGTNDLAITPGATGWFTLTLADDSAFHTLTHSRTIRVYQQPETRVEDQTAIPALSTVRVHGLLFRDGEQWVLVASTIASA